MNTLKPVIELSMAKFRSVFVSLAVLVLSLLAHPMSAFAQADAGSDAFIFGVKVRAGGRFDNVRACAASPAGTKGGAAADVSFFAELGISEKIAVHIDLPVFRPIMFGAAFKMLQFEPSATLKFRRVSDGKVDFVGGPTLGLSLHYGPDYNSEVRGEGRGDSFFAMGPFVGGYVGLDFKRPGKTFNFELGLTPYVIPLFGVSDPEDHRGVVAGGLLDGAFKFNP
jgi:hypothetical protein